MLPIPSSETMEPPPAEAEPLLAATDERHFDPADVADVHSALVRRYRGVSVNSEAIRKRLFADSCG
jgi:hypothetical protein